MIGAHGRLKNLLSKRQLDVSAVRILVFDEADQMLQVPHLSVSWLTEYRQAYVSMKLCMCSVYEAYGQRSKANGLCLTYAGNRGAIASRIQQHCNAWQPWRPFGD